MVNLWLIALILIIGNFILTRILNLDFDKSISIIIATCLIVLFVFLMWVLIY
jgi:hypothetical protein